MRIRYVQDVLLTLKSCILSDGRAVVASAMEEDGNLLSQLHIIFQNLEQFPKNSVIFLASKIKDKLKGTAKKTQTREPWGSKWISFSDDISKLDLVSLCARQ